MATELATPVAQARQRSASGKFTIQLGLLSWQIELSPIRKPNTRGGQAGKLVNICPQCSGKLNQRYFCPEGHGEFRDSQEVPTEQRTGKARETDQGLVPLSAADVEAISDPREPYFLDLKVCLKSDLTPLTHPDTNAYRVRPGKVFSPTQYAILRKLAMHPTLACYGMAKLRKDGNSSPFVLGTTRGQVLLQQLIAPQDLADIDPIPAAEVPEQYTQMLDTLVNNLTAPIDLELFTNVKAANLDALVGERIGEAVPQAKTAPKSMSDEALVAALMASLEATKKPDAPKAAPRARKPRQVPVEASNEKTASRRKVTAA